MIRLSPVFGLILLLASIALNIGLIITCIWFYQTAQSHYTDYRYFRALGAGTSESTSLPDTDRIDGHTTVVLFGDSRIQTWWPQPSFENTTFINAGVSGETTTEMKQRFEHDVLRHSPDIVIMQAGVNDLTASVTKGISKPQQLTDTMQTNMEYFISTMTDQNIVVIVTSIFPNAEYSIGKKLFWQNNLPEKIADNNNALKSITEKSNAIWLDLSTVFYGNDGQLQSDLYFDTLHVSPAAYKLLNKIVTGLIPELSR